MTLREMLEKAVRSHPGHVALRFKAEGLWSTVTYAQLLGRVRRVAELLGQQGLRPGDRVALMLPNVPEWPEIYFGITSLGLTAVPLDPKLHEQEVAYLLRDSGARLIFCLAAIYPTMTTLAPEVPDLEFAFLLGPPGNITPDVGLLRCAAYDQAMARTTSAAGYYDRFQPRSDDLASFIYTSGTTGSPKGAMLTHGNFTSNVAAMCQRITVRADDNFLLVLPWHHAFAFSACLTTPLSVGATISLIENLKTLSDDMRATQPTVLIGVPLLMEKMYRRIMDNLQGNPVGWLLFKLGVLGPITRKIRAALGGRLRMVVTGGAPCDPDLLRGFDHLGFELLEGYGLTETAPVLTLNPQQHAKPGSVGPALPDVELRILDPSADGIGEIVVRGPNVMRGYHNNVAATTAAFCEGWFLTGDLGRLDADGYVFITGRKKCLIVNREGKNINPEEIETYLMKCPLIKEALALGYREADERVGEHIGLMVVPTEEALALPNAEQQIRTEIKRLLRGVADYKHPRRMVIRTEEFEKTTTGKIKRFIYTMPPT